MYTRFLVVVVVVDLSCVGEETQYKLAEFRVDWTEYTVSGLFFVDCRCCLLMLYVSCMFRRFFSLFTSNDTYSSVEIQNVLVSEEVLFYIFSSRHQYEFLTRTNEGSVK